MIASKDSAAYPLLLLEDKAVGSIAQPTVFSPGMQKILLFYPLLIFAAILYEIIAQPIWMKENYNVLYAIQMIVLLNANHAIATFMMIFILPELREFRQRFDQKNRLSLLQRTTLVFVGLTISFFIYWSALITYFPKYTFPLMTMLLIIYQMHHLHSQTFGISNLFGNLSAQKNSEEVRKKLLFERRAIKLIAFLQCCTFAITTVFELKSRLSMMIILILAIAMASIAIHLILHSYRHFGVQGKSKALFLSRLLLAPFTGFSFLGATAGGFHHGVDYLFVVQKMCKRSQVSRMRFRYILIALLAMIAMAGLVGMRPYIFGTTFFKDYVNAPMIIHLFAALSMGVAYTHIWLDRQIFRFSDEDARDQILPLIS